MEPSNESNTKTGTSSEFLQAIRSSAILSEKQFEKVEANVAEGNYPPEPAELASRLVKDGVLTDFQARQILKGKSQGLVFGRYVILDFLGKGAMGRVYKAWHRMMGRVVALKILDPRCVANTRSLARFQREMQLVGRLDHPNVVRAFDADRVGDYHFIAMEYVAGQTLEDLLKERGALPPADVVYFASQAADGLAHAHALGVLHRDIKPSNLLLTDARKVKILDFGLGTLLEKDELPGRTDGRRDHRRDARLHLAGAGPDGQARRPQRPLLARLHDVPPDQRATPLQGRVVDGLHRRADHGEGDPDQPGQAGTAATAGPDDRETDGHQPRRQVSDGRRGGRRPAEPLRPKNLPADRPATTVAAVAPVPPRTQTGPENDRGGHPRTRTEPGGGYRSRDPFAAPRAGARSSKRSRLHPAHGRPTA